MIFLHSLNFEYWIRLFPALDRWSHLCLHLHPLTGHKSPKIAATDFSKIHNPDPGSKNRLKTRPVMIHQTKTPVSRGRERSRRRITDDFRPRFSSSSPVRRV